MWIACKPYCTGDCFRSCVFVRNFYNKKEKQKRDNYETSVFSLSIHLHYIKAFTGLFHVYSNRHSNYRNLIRCIQCAGYFCKAPYLFTGVSG